jgi:hypothetical protein
MGPSSKYRRVELPEKTARAGQPAWLKESALAKAKDQDGAAVVAGASPPRRSVPVVVLSTSCQVLS